MRREPPQELTTAACIVDVHQDVRAIVWLRPIAQHRCLDLVQIKRHGTVAGSRLIAFFQQSHRTLLLRLNKSVTGFQQIGWSVRKTRRCANSGDYGCQLQACCVSLTRSTGSDAITLYFTSMLPLVANEYGHT